MHHDLSSPGAIVFGCIVGVVSSATQSLGLTLQRKSHLVETYARHSIASSGIQSQNRSLHDGSDINNTTGLGISGSVCDSRTREVIGRDDFGLSGSDEEGYRRSSSPQLKVPLHRRSMWQLGVFLFIASNILGSSVQISTLPLIVLSPLQAVGLVFNSIYASILLNEPYTRLSMVGTILVTLGAVVIAAFGALPEPNHNLSQLLELFARSQFVAWMVCSLLGVVVVVLVAHSLPSCHSSSKNSSSPTMLSTRLNHSDDSGSTDIFSAKHRSPYQRPSNDDDALQKHLSNSSLASASSSTSSSSQSKTPVVDYESSILPVVHKLKDSSSARNSLSSASHVRLHIDTNVENGYSSISSPMQDLDRSSFDESRPLLEQSHGQRQGHKNYKNLWSRIKQLPGQIISSVRSLSSSHRAPLIKGSLFGTVSGILSAHSLLMAKAAVELIVRGFSNNWQDYARWESWLIVVAFISLAVLQLYFLNCGLHILSTSVLYPLIFCVYNLTSIFNSLIFYKQTSKLSYTQLTCVALGTLLVVSGVACLSWRLQYHGSVGTNIPDSPGQFSYSPSSSSGLNQLTPYHRLSDSYFSPTTAHSQQPQSAAATAALDISSDRTNRPILVRKGSQRQVTVNIGMPSPYKVSSPSFLHDTSRGDEYTSFRSLAAHPPESTSPFSGKKPVFRRERAWSLEQREIISQLAAK